jgi:DNA-binding LacI/PurR family transcriptional regulator
MKKPTLQDVADRASVSRALVSLVMRDAQHVSSERRQRVLRAANDLGYRPNVLARNLATGRSRTIGVVVNDLRNPFFAEALEGVEQAAADAGYQVLIANGGRRADREREAAETFLELRNDGIILLGPRMNAKAITATCEGAPTVLVGRPSRSKLVDSINNNERLGSGLAVRHLHELGHTRITHIDGGAGAGAQPRRKGYEAAMTSLGLSEHIRMIPGDFTEAAGAKAAEQILTKAQSTTAIFAANDLIAAGARDRLESAGVIVPAEVSIIGYDNSAFTSMRHVSMSTIAQPMFEMGSRALQLLLERLEDGRSEAVHEIIDPVLVARETTSKAPTL